MGKLYVCGTPIGNLEDVSIRLLKTLRGVDMIACEDTRHSIKLLNRYKIKNKLISYHEHSGPDKESYILEQLRIGGNIALISDAGMPTISDPGESLVRHAIEAGIEVEVIPGPSACTAALAISGLDSSSFIFVGFLPPRAGKRRDMLESLKEEKRTVILYEAPHRLLKTLEDMEAILGAARSITVARELTKIHQEVRQGSVRDIKFHYTEHPPRGEICLLIPALGEEAKAADLDQIVRETIELIESGADKKEALKMKAIEYKVQKSTIYKMLIDK
ncbi:MAG: 16S rRNA (cytidine(1402)-2'-O)-methyltransferase [Firmicutes bacterium HGW-Firmicutes-15]|nr:MAG: 16S rRNA (cytidine(1402)-2'-O)-methyltransferase [Firmicutes bacterium HGW-Firmicutes-15]